jgi:D-proline reductase (dithiol) PrdB
MHKISFPQFDTFQGITRGYSSDINTICRLYKRKRKKILEVACKNEMRKNTPSYFSSYETTCHNTAGAEESRKGFPTSILLCVILSVMPDICEGRTSGYSKGGNKALAQLSDVDLAERLFLKGYPFNHYAPRPDDPSTTAMTHIRKPLTVCRVALVTTAGLSLPDQPPFDVAIRMGDSSFREFPGHISPQVLEIHQRSWAFDQTGVLRDRNLAFPLDRLREMQEHGEIGEVAPHHYSFMGSIAGPSRLIKQSAPEVARRLAADAVDAVLLTPV